MSQSIWQLISTRTRQMADHALDDIRTLKDWQGKQAQYRKELLHCLGLDPMPSPCDPKIKEMGSFEVKGCKARKIAFQIMPDCWAGATIYYPAKLKQGDAPAPGVLYVCGHAAMPLSAYQGHPIMWARRGYVCLILETIEQGDNPGEHHGSLMNKQELWLGLGYSAAGGETLNSLRALDILAADPLVDAGKLGVTGVSGGGALSFYVAMLDDRIGALSSLCGVSTPIDAVENRHLLNHCDCFYPHNVYGRDISVYAALIAPRAALYCFADQDPLFHPVETKAFVDRTRKIYELYGKADNCQLVAKPGKHGDQPAFDEATSKFFDKHLVGEERPLIARGKRETDQKTSDIFQGVMPSPNLLALLPQIMSPKGQVPLPMQASDWEGIRKDAIKRLRAAVPALPQTGKTDAGFTATGEWLWGEGLDVHMHKGHLEGQDLWMQLIMPTEGTGRIVICVTNAGQNVTHGLGRVSQGVSKEQAWYGSLEARFAGCHAPASDPYTLPPGSYLQTQKISLSRGMVLAGLTPVLMTVEDILALTQFIRSQPKWASHELYYYGQGDAGVAALYAGLLDERINGLILENIPSSHRDGGTLLGVMRAMDIPQAVGLMAPRKVALINQGHCFWNWPNRAYERLDAEKKLVFASDFRSGAAKLFDA